MQGDSTTGVLTRLKTTTANSPAAVFLLIGTNDIVLAVDDDEIVRNITRIITEIATGSPATRVFLQSIMPRKPKFASRIRGLNTRLAGVASETVQRGLTSGPAWRVNPAP
ncbi:GDSL-type esterase/lipase family protein [Arthrobacter sp. KNU40]|uniref:GDSL-type esterase/lipase family protein n=1 Tax=Arthrobacter sp. KNU40 TaxID=3447965 RepID=UPI003F62C07E